MPLPLPTEYKFGFVIGRAIHAIADTPADADRLPGARPAQGEFAFRPPVSLRKSSVDYHAFVGSGTVTAKLDRLGRLVDDQTWKGIEESVISGDDPDGPHGIWLITGTYSVSSKLAGMEIPGFQIEVTEAHTEANPLDLVTAAPPQPAPGVTLMTLLVPPGGGPNDTLVRGTDGNLTWSSVAYDAAQDAQAALAAIPSEVTTEVGLQVPPAVTAELATQGIVVDTTAGTKVTVGGVVVHYDSGWREIPVGYGATGKVTIVREGNRVTLSLDDVQPAPGDYAVYVAAIPTGFRPPSNQGDIPMVAISRPTPWPYSVYTIYNGTGLIAFLRTSSGTAARPEKPESASVVYSTNDPFPTVLPGTPA